MISDTTKNNLSLKYYGLIGLSLAGIASSFYYLSTLLSGSRKDDSIRCLSVGDISLSFRGKLTKERALKLMALIHNKTEKHIENVRPDLESQRRNNLNNSLNYEKLCNELLDLKNESFKKYTKEIEDKYGYSYDDISKVLEPLGPVEMEEKLFYYTVPRLPDKSLITIELISKAFEFYGNRCIEQMKNVEAMIKESSVDKKEKEYFIYQLMILKYKADDELFLKFKITENQLKFLLFEYKLHKEKKFQDILSKISEYEELFT